MFRWNKKKIFERKARILKKKNDNEFNQNESILKNENWVSNKLKNFDWLIESIHVVGLNFLK